MAYVATRGGEKAIEQAERLFRQDLGPIDAARVDTIRKTMPYLVDRVMGEASLYDEELAALALAQTGGELSEAVLVLRAWRTTQPRLAIARPVQQDEVLTQRRISAAFKDIPGGQILGPTLDYSHRVLATDVLEGKPFTPPPVDSAQAPAPERQPSLAEWQRQQGLVAPATEPDTAPEDIPDLVRHFLARFAAEEGRPHISTAAPDAVAMLQAYDWPGNIRQLENAVFRAVVLCEGDHLVADDFPQVQASVGSLPAASRSAIARPPVSHEAGPASQGEGEPGGETAASQAPQTAGVALGDGGGGPATPFGYVRSLDDHGHVRKLEDVEAEMIRTAIDHYGGRMTEVARRLSIGRSTLYRKLKDYGLDATPDAEAAE